MPSVIPLGSLLGAALLGTIISAVIYGITCLQTHLYYTKYTGNDGRAMKFVVALVWVLDSFHLALITIMVYHYTVTNWGDLLVLARTTWSLGLNIMIGNILTSIVQCFYARQIWRLSGKNWALTGTIVLLSLIQLGFGTAFIVHGFQTQFFAADESKANKSVAVAALSGDISCDIVITVSMCYYLHKSRTGFKGTDTIINMLITYAIRTCLLTTICIASSLITFIVLTNTMIHSAFYFIACRLYVNSFLSTLNARARILDKGQASDIISLGRFAGSGQHSSKVVVIAPDKRSPTEAHSQPHRSSKIHDSIAKLPV